MTDISRKENHKGVGKLAPLSRPKCVANQPYNITVLKHSQNSTKFDIQIFPNVKLYIERRLYMSKTYSYNRISTHRQNIDRQIRNALKLYPDAIIIKETYTGTKFQGRKEFDKLLKIIKEGDTIVFDSVSRMSRNADEGVALYMELYDKGINLVFIKEPHINTDTYKSALSNKISLVGDDVDEILKGVNSYLKKLAQKQIRIAFEQSEKEVEDLRQRTREGIETARLNGKQIGQKQDAKLITKKSIAAKKVILEHAIDFGGTLKDIDVIKVTGLSRNTYYKYKRELSTEMH